MAVSSISDFSLKIDNLIGESTSLLPDERPIVDEEKFTRACLENLSGLQYSVAKFSLWCKKKFGSLSLEHIGRQVANFLQNSSFKVEWMQLSGVDQTEKLPKLCKAIAKLKKDIDKKRERLEKKRSEIKKMYLVQRLFYKIPPTSLIKEYGEVGEKLQLALNALEGLKPASITKKQKETPIRYCKLYARGIHLPRLLKEDLFFARHPNVIEFLSNQDLSTTPFVAMIRQIEQDYTNEGKKLQGEFQTVGLKTILINPMIHTKEEVGYGTLDQKEILKFNRICIKYLKQTFYKDFVQGLMEKEEMLPYLNGGRVITGEIFDKLFALCTHDKFLRENPKIETKIETPEPFVEEIALEIPKTTPKQKESFLSTNMGDMLKGFHPTFEGPRRAFRAIGSLLQRPITVSH